MHTHCPQCSAKLTAVIRPKSVHYADMICRKCEAHFGYMPWPLDKYGVKVQKPEPSQIDIFKGGDNE